MPQTSPNRPRTHPESHGVTHSRTRKLTMFCAYEAPYGDRRLGDPTDRQRAANDHLDGLKRSADGAGAAEHNCEQIARGNGCQSGQELWQVAAGCVPFPGQARRRQPRTGERTAHLHQSRARRRAPACQTSVLARLAAWLSNRVRICRCSIKRAARTPQTTEHAYRARDCQCVAPAGATSATRAGSCSRPATDARDGAPRAARRRGAPMALSEWVGLQRTHKIVYHGGRTGDRQS